MQPHNISVFIFRRDHRLEDNTALLYALQQSLQVFPCFIFDSVQIDPSRNPYFGNNCVQFMIESLRDLDARLKEQGSRLFFFHGEIEQTITHILKTVKPDALYINEDVTPYARKRDTKIAEICRAHSVKFYAYEDIMILPKNVVRDKDGTTFKVSSPYHREAIKFTVTTPFKNDFGNYYLGEAKVEGEYPLSEIGKFYKENPDLEVHGGRTNALQILDDIQSFKNYGTTSSIPHIPTTKLSAYNKFGCVSIREVYWSVANTLGKNCNLMKELFWRDFYYYLAYHDPSYLEEGMKPEYHDIKYEDNMEYFEKWKNAETGCPIVDAGMRHLNKTGFMPNRLRMTVANFLIKDLLVSWKHGERYFAQMLVDYDPCQNNGGWQWCSSTGADSRDFLRIFNPALQSQKFDPDCKYILKWIPELTPVSKENIHNWETNYQLYSAKKLGYSNPIIKHAVQRKKCIEMYNNAKPVKEGNLHGSQSTQGEGGEETKENIHENGAEKNLLKRKAENGHEMTPNLKKNKTSANSTPAKGVQLALTTWFKKSPADKTNQNP